MALTERTFISQFDVQPTGAIHVRKTTEILRDGESVSQSYWRCVLSPNDLNAATVLDEPYYLTLAQQAWAALPAGD